MIKLTEIQNFPDGTPIDAIQGRITAVYPARSVSNAKGTSTVQNAELSDVGGNMVKLTVWDHPDLEPLKDKEYVLHNTGGQRYPGIKVKHGSYVAKKDGRAHKAGDTVKTLELNVTKNGCFQHVEVYNQSKPADKPAAEPVSKPTSAPNQGLGVHTTGFAKSEGSYINGAKVGMAINCATQLLVAGAEAHGGFPADDVLIDRIDWMASQIITLSNRLESGKLHAVGRGEGWVDDAV